MATAGVTGRKAAAKQRPLSDADRKKQAQELVRELIQDHGLRTEAIALQTEVSNHTVIRWRDGAVAPQPGAMARLERLAEKTRTK